MKWWPAAVLLCVAGVAAAATDEEVTAALDLWLDEPLDLREASAEELALLPWLTTWQAEAIVGLRQAGGLNHWNDLASVRGLDAARLAAIEPFVELPAPPRRWGHGQVEALQRTQAESTRRWGWMRGSSGPLQGALRFDAERPSRGWVRTRWTDGELLAGDLLLDTGGTWSWSAGAGRSRTAAVSVPNGVRVRGSGLSSHWRGLALRHQWAPVTLLAAVDQGERTLALAELAGRGDLRTGLAWLPTTQGHRQAAWIARSGDVAWRTELVHEPRGPWRLAGMWSWRGAGWRAGLALSHSNAAVGEAFDPITGQALDRPHRAVQAHGGRWLSGWRVLALARRVWRGEPGHASVHDRSEWTVEGHPSGHAWQIRLRLDREDLAPLEAIWSGSWTEGAGAGRRLRLRWRIRQGRSATLLAGGIQRGQRLLGQLWIAGAGGDDASLWLTGVGGGLPLSQWLAPGSVASVAAVGYQAAADWTTNLWAAVELDPQARASFLAGVRIVAHWRD